MFTEDNPLLAKLIKLTTGFGIYQFGNSDQPDPLSGYALDDQARALIVADGFNNTKLKNIFLNYIVKSKRNDGLLYQFCNDDGVFLDNSDKDATESSRDAFGETIWAILKTKTETNPEIKTILNNLLTDANDWKSLRPISYALLGLTNLPKEIPLEQNFTQILIDSFETNSDKNWQWFENRLTYANPILPWALWERYLARKDQKAKEIAGITTKFLIETCNIAGIPFPIGDKGWYSKGQEKAIYDQQPIDVGYMICMLEKAYEATNDKYYLEWAEKWWKWFLGGNTQKTKMITKDYGCFDGLLESGSSQNQGAESTICFLLAALSARRIGFLNHS